MVHLCSTTLLRPADFSATKSHSPRVPSYGGDFHRKSYLHGDARDPDLRHRSGHPNGSSGNRALRWFATSVDH